MTTTVVIMEGTDVMPKSVGSGLKIRPWTWGLILFVLPAVALVVAMTVLRRSGIIGVEGTGFFFFAMFVLSTVCGILHWRGLDEPSREGHKFASVWGVGFAFLFVGLIGFEMLFFSGLRDIAQGWIDGWIEFSNGKFGDEQGPVGFYLGLLTSVILLGLGYALVWLGWWARQRIGTTAN
jgi:hypothetical protein